MTSVVVLWLLIGVLVASGSLIIVYDSGGKLTVGELFIATMLIPMGPMSIMILVLMGVFSRKMNHVVFRKKGAKS